MLGTSGGFAHSKRRLPPIEGTPTPRGDFAHAERMRCPWKSNESRGTHQSRRRSPSPFLIRNCRKRRAIARSSLQFQQSPEIPRVRVIDFLKQRDRSAVVRAVVVHTQPDTTDDVCRRNTCVDTQSHVCVRNGSVVNDRGNCLGRKKELLRLYQPTRAGFSRAPSLVFHFVLFPSGSAARSERKFPRRTQFLVP